MTFPATALALMLGLGACLCWMNDVKSRADTLALAVGYRDAVIAFSLGDTAD
ncbi:hypothetical protein C8P66_107161 [Humitalea rosea]|uniref:Uncharacterized protein n=1 Tax=Humitalea rosea TaxID=990373 RepID=A0A2W7KH29_9PROT|nr:hypothetical protein [Humitalea rosea]PZW47123.1 hypothetical protein C8P66_107161 [Humitalea rosea]